jgi:hypothetical protein
MPVAQPPHTSAEFRVSEARRIVAKQRRLLAKLHAVNGYAQREAELLAAFERALATFVADLAAYQSDAV